MVTFEVELTMESADDVPLIKSEGVVSAGVVSAGVVSAGVVSAGVVLLLLPATV